MAFADHLGALGFMAEDIQVAIGHYRLWKISGRGQRRGIPCKLRQPYSPAAVGRGEQKGERAGFCEKGGGGYHFPDDPVTEG